MLSFWTNYWRAAPAAVSRFVSSRAVSFTSVASPTGRPCQPLTAQPVAPFIEAHFRSSPTAPPFKYVTAPDEIFLTVDDEKSALAGTIRARPIGTFDGEPVSVIDCFCVRPDWRKRGLGSYLLRQLQTEAAARGRYNAIFLKEGAPLSLFGIHPFYSSVYAYRYVANGVASGSSAAKPIPTHVAHRLVDNYILLNPDTFLIRNREAANQNWFYWRESATAWVIALIQDSYQEFPNGGGKIGWMTGWLESGRLSTTARRQAAEAITAAAAPAAYDWVWLDERWTGDSPVFARDCPFHWYSYQWATSLLPGQSYCIMN